jgi:hypothetical protein
MSSKVHRDAAIYTYTTSLKEEQFEKDLTSKQDYISPCFIEYR